MPISYKKIQENKKYEHSAYTFIYLFSQDEDGASSSGSGPAGGARFSKSASPNGKSGSAGSESPKAPSSSGGSVGPAGGRRRFGSVADELDVAK